MRLADLLTHLDVLQVVGSTDRPVHRVVHDSRLASADDVFVAITGAKVDARALARDLDVAAVISDVPLPLRKGVTLVVVANPRMALAQAATALNGFPGAALPVVGVTGTNGKTTTTWMLEAIAEAAGLKSGIIGTTGFRVAGAAEPASFTTPEAPVLQDLLARMRTAGCGLVAMEVSSIGLSLHRVDGIPFRVAVFTNFSQDHLDFHGSMAAYREAKARLFRELLAPDGTAVLNADDPVWRDMIPPSGRALTTGLTGSAHISAAVVAAGLHGTDCWVRTPSGEGALRVRLPGLFNVSNALGALGAALVLGIPFDIALNGLANLRRVPGRLDPVENPGGPAIFVDYAHTPDALERVLAVLKPLTEGRLITVFGCGGERDRSKRPLMGRAASEASDHVILTSDNPRSEDPAMILAEIAAGVAGPHTIVPDRAEAIDMAIRQAGPRDCVLIAGKGHEATQTIAGLAIPFDDRLVAIRVLRNLGGDPS